MASRLKAVEFCNIEFTDAYHSYSRILTGTASGLLARAVSGCFIGLPGGHLSVIFGTDYGRPRTTKTTHAGAQTFERNSLTLLDQYMHKVPKILLLWVGEGGMTPASDKPFDAASGQSKAAYYAQQHPKDRAEFERWIDFAKANGAAGTGPSAALTRSGDQSYMDLVQPWMNTLTHDKGLLVHVYTVDDPVDYKKVMDAGVDGVFTNRASELLKFYKRPSPRSVDEILKGQGY
jgi:glycerophosphoryl diester phosphodiesterase